jgi:ABC-2 type transport system permease protein
MWIRIKALIIKELLAMLRDKRARFTLIIPPLIQLFILAQAITLEVKNISVVIFNQDAGWYSHELFERTKGSPYFTHVYNVDSHQALQKVIDNQKALIGIEINSNFSRILANKQPAELQLILDGRRSNAAQIAQLYFLKIIQRFNTDIQIKQNNYVPPQVIGIFRSWFNPNLDYLLYTVPCLVGILSMMLGLLVTALSVAREREMGNFDQLLVSPLQTWEILVGKMLPAMIIGISESTVIMILSMVLYNIPFHGSLLLFYFSMIIFITSIIGVGLFISALSQTQQQAMLGSFVFMVPTMLLSGFATPIENMPVWLQPVSWFIPITHFFIIIKGVFLKDMSSAEVLWNAWPMAVIALFTLSVAGWMFKRRLE